MAALLKPICKAKVEKGWHKGGECTYYDFLKKAPKSTGAETDTQGWIPSVE